MNYTPAETSVFADPLVEEAISDAQNNRPLRKRLPDELVATQREGVPRAVAEIYNQAIRCPEQRFVLAGYSQGAWVLGDALADSRLEPFYDRIDTVLLFGDPMFDPNSPAAQRTLPGQTGPGAGPRDTVGLAAYVNGPREDYLPEALENRSQSYCFGSPVTPGGSPVDPVCATPPDPRNDDVLSGPEWADSMEKCSPEGLFELFGAGLTCSHAHYSGQYATEFMTQQLLAGVTP
ncbi:cutinase family protein [Streptomyces montanus]|uniref:cutinase family protein n=1 Tax=Streptomyces montanus TaxID=2580423 RepID=UPI001BB23C2D|nr:cutinase family protein [Streptomyces montanus]